MQGRLVEFTGQGLGNVAPCRGRVASAGAEAYGFGVLGRPCHELLRAMARHVAGRFHDLTERVAWWLDVAMRSRTSPTWLGPRGSCEDGAGGVGYGHSWLRRSRVGRLMEALRAPGI